MDFADNRWERLDYYYLFLFYTFKSNFIESQEKSTGENALAIEALLDGSEEAYECVSFDFEKCSLNSLQNDYPKLFQFDHEQHMYVYIILNRIFYHQFFLERALVPTREKAYISKLFILCIIIFVVKLPILFVIKDNWQKLVLQLVIEFADSCQLLVSSF